MPRGRLFSLLVAGAGQGPSVGAACISLGPAGPVGRLSPQDTTHPTALAAFSSHGLLGLDGCMSLPHVPRVRVGGLFSPSLPALLLGWGSPLPFPSLAPPRLSLFPVQQGLHIPLPNAHVEEQWWAWRWV